MERFQKMNYLLFWGVVVTALFLDYITKALTTRPTFTSIEVIPNWLKFIHTTNDGIAFSIAIPYWVQILATLIILSVFFGYSTEIICDRKSKAFLQLTLLGIIIGGALGNLIDRIRLGHVNDFISIKYFPVFNLADVFITVGIAGLLILLFKTEKKHD